MAAAFQSNTFQNDTFDIGGITMPRTALVATSIKFVKGPNPGTVIAGDLTVLPVVADVANGNSFIPSVDDEVHFINTHASSPFTVTLNSAPDERKRLGDITAYNLAAGDIGCFRLGDLIGWIQSDGTVWINANNAAIKFWIERRA